MPKPRFFRFFRHLNWHTLKKTFARTTERRLLGLASEIAFNAMLSLFPAILALITAIGLLAQSLQATFKQLADQLSQVLPEQALDLIRDLLPQKLPTPKTAVYFL